MEGVEGLPELEVAVPARPADVAAVRDGPDAEVVGDQQARAASEAEPAPADPESKSLWAVVRRRSDQRPSPRRLLCCAHP